jgi:hypothetical protein
MINNPAARVFFAVSFTCKQFIIPYLTHNWKKKNNGIWIGRNSRWYSSAGAPIGVWNRKR